jgi:hypothetical protein
MRVKCGFGHHKHGGHYTCYVNEIEANEKLWRNRYGPHQPDMSNDDVKMVYFFINVNSIPRQLNFREYPNLNTLELRHCGLKTICHEDLKEFTNLDQLYLPHNELTILPDDLLEDLTKLTTISFFSNKIEKMSSNLLKPIRNNQLKNVDFRMNPKVNVYHSRPFDDVTSVSELIEIIDEQLSTKCLVSRKVRGSMPVIQQKALSIFENLWKYKTCSDFTVIVNKSTFRVHKCVLAVQSKVFAELFDKEPNADKLEIKYLAPEALEAFLEYLYLGKYLTFGDKFFQLLALASRFKVSSLKELMMDSVPSQLTDRNALQVFSLAHSLESIELKRIAFERIQQMMPGISLSDFLFDDLALLTELVEAKQKFVAVLQKVQEKSQK